MHGVGLELIIIDSMDIKSPICGGIRSVEGHSQPEINRNKRINVYIECPVK